MTKQWFVLHTLTGQENKVQKSIEARVRLERMDEYIGRCVIPTEKVVEKKNGKKRTTIKKFFPGYVIAELALYREDGSVDENGKRAIYDQTWQFLRSTPGVIGFVGGAGVRRHRRTVFFHLHVLRFCSTSLRRPAAASVPGFPSTSARR